MAPFALSAGLAALRRSQFFNEQLEIMQELEGVADGGRRTFRTANKPLIWDPSGFWGPASTLVIYDADEREIQTALYTVLSTKAGAVQFLTPPSLTRSPKAPLYASYTWGDLDLPTLYGVLLDGFGEMEQRFPRGLRLVALTGATTPIPGQTDMAVVDAQGNDPTGPSGAHFSESVFQMNLLALCAAYRLHRDYMGSQAKSAYGYRESRMGMEINPAPALKLSADYMKELSAQVGVATERAQEEWWSAQGGMGGAVLNPSSASYDTLFDWQRHASLSTRYGGLSW
jgi:hypothetical protein